MNAHLGQSTEDTPATKHSEYIPGTNHRWIHTWDKSQVNTHLGQSIGEWYGHTGCRNTSVCEPLRYTWKKSVQTNYQLNWFTSVERMQDYKRSFYHTLICLNQHTPQQQPCLSGSCNRLEFHAGLNFPTCVSIFPAQILDDITTLPVRWHKFMPCFYLLNKQEVACLLQRVINNNSNLVSY